MNQARHINTIRWVVLGAGILSLLLILFVRPSALPELEISQVIQMADDGRVAKIQVRGDALDVTTIDGETFRSRKENRAGASVSTPQSAYRHRSSRCPRRSR